jgi:hypothetical protein
MGPGRRRLAIRRHPQLDARPHARHGAARRPPLQPRALPARRFLDDGDGLRRTVGTASSMSLGADALATT